MSPIERSAGGGGSGGFANPMTTQGDIIIENAVPAPARLAIGTAGQTLGVSGGLPAWALPPGFQFDYAQVTADTTVTATTDATATTIITGNAVTYDGSTTVELRFYGGAQIGTLNEVVTVVYDGATDLGRLSFAGNLNTTNATDFWLAGGMTLTPSNAAHTYSIRAWKTGASACKVYGGTGGAGVTLPAWFRIVKV